MQTIKDLGVLRTARDALSGRVALVPTMGALHQGHMKLVDLARAHADHVVVSIFVNPMQFGPNEDLARYPRCPDDDAAMLAKGGVGLLWMPSAATMYPPDFATKVSVAGLSDGQCAVSRPGHFDGVATVVAKLFSQVRPDCAVFGEKDWQQLKIIKQMVLDLDMPVKIVAAPIDREADGLARSSRNAYLTPEERRLAPVFPETLHAAADSLAQGTAVSVAVAAARERLTAHGFTFDYLELVDSVLKPVTMTRDAERLMAAVRLGTTRLIDNVSVNILTC